VEQVPEADGITPEVMQQQRDRITLAQSCRSPRRRLPALIHHDADIDALLPDVQHAAQRLRGATISLSGC
jgi:hypothetical protein